MNTRIGKGTTARLLGLTSLLAAFLAMPLQTAAQSSAQGLEIVRVQASDPVVRQRLGVLAGHFLFDADSGIAQVETDPLTRRRMAAMGLRWEVDDAASAAYQAYVAAGTLGLRSIPGFQCYRTVEETYQSMDQMAAAFPQLADVVEIGSSWLRTQDSSQGYPLRVLRMTNRQIPGQKPIMFAVSSVHAREYTPAELMTRFAESLLAGYGVDADATWLLDHNEFHLLLQGNPDGRKHAEQAVLWRKNVNDVDGSCPQPTFGDHPGIDLNRNFPWGWNSNGGSSGIQCRQTYRGPSAGSEPETFAITDYLMSVVPDRRPGDPQDTSIPADPDTQGMFLDVHSYSRLVLWPWGGKGLTANDQAFINLGRRLAWFNGYEPKQSVALYPTDGTTIDFAYGELGLPAFTYELGTSFFQDCAEFEATVLPDNLASLYYAARTLHAPYQLPAGPDVHGLTLEQAIVAQGQSVRLTAVVDDRGYQPGPGAPSVPQLITGADLHINQLPWQSVVPGQPLVADDGSFDATHETVALDLETGALSPGRYMLVVQGRNAADKVGPPAAIFLEVFIQPIFGDGFESLPNP